MSIIHCNVLQSYHKHISTALIFAFRRRHICLMNRFPYHLPSTQQLVYAACFFFQRRKNIDCVKSARRASSATDASPEQNNHAFLCRVCASTRGSTWNERTEILSSRCFLCAPSKIGCQSARHISCTKARRDTRVLQDWWQYIPALHELAAKCPSKRLPVMCYLLCLPWSRSLCFDFFSSIFFSGALFFASKFSTWGDVFLASIFVNV